MPQTIKVQFESKVESQVRTSTFTNIIQIGAAGRDGVGGSALTVREVDGSPTGTATVLEVPSGSLTYPSSGVARLTLPGGGTVTSIQVSGGSTGFTFSGGPITSAGTLTMGVSNAGTARTALGLGSAAVANMGDFESAGAVSSAFASHLAAVDPHPNYTTASELASALTAYQPFDADLNAIAGLTGTNTIYYRSGAGTWSEVTIGDNLTFSSGKLSASVSGGGGGTVTSVDVSGGSTGLTFSGGPITGSGVVTLAVGNAATFRAAIGAGTSSFDGAYSSLTGVPSTFAPSSHSHVIADTTGLQAALDLKAPLVSPALTGTPTAPTATAGTNTTQLATTAFVLAEVAALVSAAPGALDTLDELAAALGDDPNFATTITTSLAGKQPLDATLTGIAATSPTADQLIYATGNDTFATASLTAFARSILDDANSGAVLATIGAAASTHVHGNITNAGAIGSTANLPLITTTSGVITVGSFGTSAATFCEGNDSRLSDARTPTSHNQAWSTITSTPTTLAGYGITDAQPLDADLTAIASLSTQAFGRSLLTQSDAPTARGTLGLATIASTYNDSAPANGTIVLSAKAAYGFTINELRGLDTSAGTLTLTIQINGTNVTGLTNISVTTTPQDVSATGANVVAVGDRVTLVIASVSGAAGLEFTMRGTR